MHPGTTRAGGTDRNGLTTGIVLQLAGIALQGPLSDLRIAPRKLPAAPGKVRTGGPGLPIGESGPATATGKLQTGVSGLWEGESTGGITGSRRAPGEMDHFRTGDHNGYRLPADDSPPPPREKAAGQPASVARGWP